jgi:hypoxanthine phosphoribosyltransferase
VADSPQAHNPDPGSLSRADPAMHGGVDKIILSAEAIAARVASLSDEVAAACDAESLTVVGVLNGSLIFLADLVRRLPMRVQYDVIRAESYVGVRSSGQVRLRGGLPPIGGRDVLLVDDVLDTGLTLATVYDHLLSAKPRSLRTAVLLRKRPAREAGCKVDFVGFDLDDDFVVGYGLDYEGRYRNLPYIGRLGQGAGG